MLKRQVEDSQLNMVREYVGPFLSSIGIPMDLMTFR